MKDCEHKRSCVGRVAVCEFCAKVNGHIVCRGCYKEGWKNRCFWCRRGECQRLSTQQLLYCVKCFKNGIEQDKMIKRACRYIQECLPYERQDLGDSGSRMDMGAKRLADVRLGGEWQWHPDMVPCIFDIRACHYLRNLDAHWEIHCDRLSGRIRKRKRMLTEKYLHFICPYRWEHEIVWEWMRFADNHELIPKRNCFMELIDAMGPLDKQLFSPGDSIQTAHWAGFLIQSEHALTRLNDFRLWFQKVFGWSWEKLRSSLPFADHEQHFEMLHRSSRLCYRRPQSDGFICFHYRSEEYYECDCWQCKSHDTMEERWFHKYAYYDDQDLRYRCDYLIHCPKSNAKHPDFVRKSACAAVWICFSFEAAGSHYCKMGGRSMVKREIYG